MAPILSKKPERGEHGWSAAPPLTRGVHAQGETIESRRLRLRDAGTQLHGNATPGDRVPALRILTLTEVAIHQAKLSAEFQGFFGGNIEHPPANGNWAMPE